MLNLAFNVGATLAALGVAAWAYPVIKENALAWASGPNQRRRVSFAKMLPGHWAGVAILVLVLVGVWS